MIAVYETIDLGLIESLKAVSPTPNFSPVTLLQGNNPVIFTDPIHKDTAYIYHAFGVHVLNIGPVLQHLATALRGDDDASGTQLESSLKESVGTSVQPILSTFSIEGRSVQ
jgi:nucleoporin NUP82